MGTSEIAACAVGLKVFREQRAALVGMDFNLFSKM